MLASQAFSTVFGNIASYFSMPSIGGLYFKEKTVDAGKPAGIMKALDLFQIGIPIYTDKYEERGGNEIGEQILVSAIGSDDPGIGDATGSLVKVADNIVVTPKTWIIHGYVGINENDILTTALKRVVPFMNVVSTFGRQMLLETFRMVLRYICDARKPFKFYSADGDTIPSLIKSYSAKKAPENDNWIELDIEIQEFRYIAMTKDDEQVSGGFKAGITGKSALQKLGRTALKKLFI